MTCDDVQPDLMAMMTILMTISPWIRPIHNVQTVGENGIFQSGIPEVLRMEKSGNSTKSDCRHTIRKPK